MNDAEQNAVWLDQLREATSAVAREVGRLEGENAALKELLLDAAVHFESRTVNDPIGAELVGRLVAAVGEQREREGGRG